MRDARFPLLIPDLKGLQFALFYTKLYFVYHLKMQLKEYQSHNGFPFRTDLVWCTCQLNYQRFVQTKCLNGISISLCKRIWSVSKDAYSKRKYTSLLEFEPSASQANALLLGPADS